jgi:hypothetical protein
MNVIDKFLPGDVYVKIWNHLQTLQIPLECPSDEEDHQGLINCERFAIQEDIKTLFANELIRGSICKNNPKFEITYHKMKSPYWSYFHCDRLSDWYSNNIDFVGITFFMNESWYHNDGGLFVWKRSWNNDQGEYLEPIQNRLIVNPYDYPHAVTQITTPIVIRHSIQIFIAKEFVL